MKSLPFKISTIIIILFIVKLSSAQQGLTKVYEETYKSLQSSSIIQTFDNNLLIGGSYENQNLVLKVNLEGDSIWNKSYGYNNGYGPNVRINKLLDSTYLVTSAAYYSEVEGYIMNFIKLTESGDSLWSSFNVLPEYLINYSIEQVYDSGFVICGEVETIEATSFTTMLLIKLDKFAQYEWAKTIEILNNSNAVNSVIQTPDSNLIVSGFAINSNEYFSELILLKYTIDGDLVWSKSYNYNNYVYWKNTKVVATEQSLILISVYSNYTLITKTNYDGEIIWSRQVNTYFNSFSNYVNIESYLLNENELAILVPDNLFKINTDGEFIWSTNLWMYAIDFVTIDNDFYVTGNGPIIGVKDDNYYPYPQIGLYKLDSTGLNSEGCIYSDNLTIIPVELVYDTLIVNAIDIDLQDISVPVSFNSISFFIEDKCVDFIGSTNELIEGEITVYPNPNKGSFEIVSDNNISIKKIQILNSSGQLVYEQTNNGESNMQINIKDNLHGIFLLKVFSENSTLCKKLIIN